MPETQVGNRKVEQTEIERDPLFASVEMAAEQITSTIGMIPSAPDYVKEAANNFVESLRKWARGGKEGTPAELAQQGKAPEHVAAQEQSEESEESEEETDTEKKTDQ